MRQTSCKPGRCPSTASPASLHQLRDLYAFTPCHFLIVSSTLIWVGCPASDEPVVVLVPFHPIEPTISTSPGEAFQEASTPVLPSGSHQTFSRPFSYLMASALSAA